ncbi:hypothetical protein WMY93_013484 [Mugilogobius chulae]|uniref:Large ribosomal subunit protein uL16m n=1 Tax=Mugilogobius chulae TaxID=88201 RepID=A0AAW0P037_9GOBI
MISLFKAAVGGVMGVCANKTGLLHSHLKVLSAGLKTYEIPPDYSDAFLPDKPKLKFLNKVPNLKKAKKEMKRLRDIQGPAKAANTFSSGQYAIVALGGGYLHWGHMEMMRLTINRKMDPKTMFARWRVNAPTNLSHAKGAIDHYVTPVKYGRLIVEVGGKVELGEVEHILIEVAKKLPFPTKVLSREGLEAMHKEQAEREENNQNPGLLAKLLEET